MTQEEKDLLLKDLCARLPYNVKIEITILETNKVIVDQFDYMWLGILYSENTHHIIKPYLRPMSSMTKEERKELNNQGYTKIAGELYHYCALSSDNAFYNPERHSYVRLEYVIKLIDWLNSHHFDYRGLIEKGLALETPKDMYNLNEE